MDSMNFKTLNVRFQDSFCFVQFNRPEANNAVNNLMAEEFLKVLGLCEESATVIVLEGSPEYFCSGADFRAIHDSISRGTPIEQDPEPLYDVWIKLATGPYITVAHTRGKSIAGGVGFAAACDIVLADSTAQFSLSELLFGLFPACILVFLIRKIGYQKAHYMSVMTQPIPVQQAHSWGLVDAYDTQSDQLLRKHLLRLKYLSKKTIARYKNYINKLNDSITRFKSLAIASNKEVFSDPENLDRIYRFIQNGNL
jgi:polyketide biosynthesis enoyl-CoA hydratase PksH